MQNLQQDVRHYSSQQGQSRSPSYAQPYAQPYAQSRSRQGAKSLLSHHRLGANGWKDWRGRLEILGAGGLAVVSFLLGMGYRWEAAAATRQGLCQAVEHSTAVLSRQQLSQLLTVAERSPRQKVRAIAKEPYCKMASLEVRAGVQAEREAYPLAFDPNTWLVVLYEGGEYAGYSFSFMAP
jgi:hypothetical protein